MKRYTDKLFLKLVCCLVDGWKQKQGVRDKEETVWAQCSAVECGGKKKEILRCWRKRGLVFTFSIAKVLARLSLLEDTNSLGNSSWVSNWQAHSLDDLCPNDKQRGLVLQYYFV